MWRRDRHGFTLIELMLAITLTAGLLLSGRLLLEQIVNSGQAIARERKTIDTSIARERTLRNLFRNIEIGTSDSATFGGTERTMQFTSWCDSAGGLRGRCGVSLTIDTVLTATLSGGASGSLTLAGDTTAGAFIYLGDSHDGGSWFHSWGTSIIAPPAVGVVFGTDTTVLRIGDRG